MESVQKECIDRLDLTYKPSDIEMIAKEGADSLENGYTDGILESLSLFAELMGYQPPTKAFRIPHYEISGAVTVKQASEILYGPIVILSLIDNSLGLIEYKISNLDKGKIELFQKIAQGKEKPSIEGKEVFRYLKDAVLNH